MTLKQGATYQIKQKTKQTGEVSKKGKDVNYSHKFIFDRLSRNKRIAHFIHEKCGYRESFSAHALACGIISIKEIKNND